MPDKKEIINHLEEIADMLEFKGENKFKINAYRNGAAALRKVNSKAEEIFKNRDLDKVKGIGKTLQSIIYEYYDKGETSIHNDLRKNVPEGIEHLLKIKGLGHRKVRILYHDYGIKNIEELEEAARENRLAHFKGFTQEKQAEILEEIKKAKFHSNFVLLNAAYNFRDELSEKFKGFKSIVKAEPTGELRRGMEVISSIEFIILTKNEKKLLEELKKSFRYKKEKNILKIDEYFEISVKLIITTNESDYIWQKFISTGSDQFINKLKIKGKISAKSEEAILKKLRAPVIPEMREKQYFELNKKLQSNSDLDEKKIKGLIHFHSTYSDGRDSVAEMVEAMDKVKFKYAVLTDHSRSAYYANGLKEEKLIEQIKEVIGLRSQIKLHLFQGIESDILQSGELDYPNEILSEFDLVIASVHSRFGMNEREMTKRMLRAIENPYTDILAHPSGRMLLRRDPYKFDVKKIIDACFANDVAIEINSNPRRLDLDWRWLYYARERGCRFAINPDAHSVNEISFIKYGIKMAKKGGVMSNEVINSFSLEKFKKYLNRKVKRNFI